MKRALICDFGGVLTTPVLDSYLAFCQAEDVDPRAFRKVIRAAYREATDDDPIVQLELGLIELAAFEARLAGVLSAGLGRTIAAADLAHRIMGATKPEPRMLDAVARAREAGVTTGLLSNSWGNVDYPPQVTGLFDSVVISAQARLRKPDPKIFALACEELAVAPEACVFVDDARPNCEVAESLGMHAILHRDPDQTLPEIERELGVTLR